MHTSFPFCILQPNSQWINGPSSLYETEISVFLVQKKINGLTAWNQKNALHLYLTSCGIILLHFTSYLNTKIGFHKLKIYTNIYIKSIAIQRNVKVSIKILD